MSSVLTRDALLAKTKRRFKTITLAGGDTLRIRSLTAGEWATIDSGNVNKKKGGLDAAGLRLSDLRLFAAAVCDDNGERLFNDADVAILEGLDNAVVSPVVREIREHCGLRDSVEDAEKNSVTTTTGSSPSSCSEPQGPPGSTG